MAQSKIWSVGTTPEKSISYISQLKKTMEGTLLLSNRCSTNWELANIQMEAHRKRFGKNSGTLLHHGEISFKGYETSPEVALNFAEEFMKGFFNNYQYIASVHVDTSNLHIHFIINSVGFDGKKYNRCDNTTAQMRAWVDTCCEKYNLSVIKPKGIGKSYKEWMEQKQGTAWKDLIKLDVDAAIDKANSFDEFLKILKEEGYFIKQGENVKHMVLKKRGMEGKGCRSRKLGTEYTEEAIKSRIKYKEFGFTVSSIKLRRPKKKLRPIEKEMRKIYFRHAEMATNVALGIHVLNSYLTGQKVEINSYPKYRRNKINYEARKEIKKLERQLRFIKDKSIKNRNDLEFQKSQLNEKLEHLYQKEKVLIQEKKNLNEIKKNIIEFEKFTPIYEELVASGTLADFRIRAKNQWTVDKYVQCKNILEENGLVSKEQQSVFFMVFNENKNNSNEIRNEIKEVKNDLDKYYELEDSIQKIRKNQITEKLRKEINRESFKEQIQR